MEAVGHAEVRELRLIPAQPHARRDPATAEGIERRELLGQDDRIPLRDHDDAGPEADPLVPGADPGEGEDGLVDPAVVSGRRLGHENVVGRPDRREAEGLGDAGRGVDRVG